jgi:hypothetical protein
LGPVALVAAIALIAAVRWYACATSSLEVKEGALME